MDELGEIKLGDLFSRRLHNNFNYHRFWAIQLCKQSKQLKNNEYVERVCVRECLHLDKSRFTVVSQRFYLYEIPYANKTAHKTNKPNSKPNRMAI